MGILYDHMTLYGYTETMAEDGRMTGQSRVNTTVKARVKARGVQGKDKDRALLMRALS